MDFSISETLAEKKKVARKWAREEIVPLEKDYYEGNEVPDEERLGIQNRLKELGLWSLGVPEELGGQGIGWLGMQLMHEEAGYTSMFNHWAFLTIAGNPPANLYDCLGNDYHK
jgi:alkylation response protein AidB-like acyl-CoA dehydrogenase